jgi:hypothetical protein
MQSRCVIWLAQPNGESITDAGLLQFGRVLPARVCQNIIDITPKTEHKATKLSHKQSKEQENNK